MLFFMAQNDHDENDEWQVTLAHLTDIFKHLNSVNVGMQGRPPENILTFTDKISSLKEKVLCESWTRRTEQLLSPLFCSRRIYDSKHFARYKEPLDFFLSWIAFLFLNYEHQGIWLDTQSFYFCYQRWRRNAAKRSCRTKKWSDPQIDVCRGFIEWLSFSLSLLFLSVSLSAKQNNHETDNFYPYLVTGTIHLNDRIDGTNEHI